MSSDGNGVHASIINRYLGGGSYEVIDFNYVAHHQVGVHTYTPPSYSQIWRMATVHVSSKSLAANRYVSAELGYTGADYAMLGARSAGVGSWERFTLKGDCSQAWSICSDANGLYLGAELGSRATPGARPAPAPAPPRAGSSGTSSATATPAARCSRSPTAGTTPPSSATPAPDRTCSVRARAATASGWQQYVIA